MKFIDSRMSSIATYETLSRSPGKYNPLAGEGTVLLRITVKPFEVSPAVDVKVQDAMFVLSGYTQSG